jgi:hypothetical protein
MTCLSASEVKQIKMAIGLLALAFLFVLSVFGFFMLYPFKTVDFVVPIAVTNKDHKVPYNGTVTMKINYVKHIDNPGLVIRTLIRKDDGGQISVLDSSTVVSTRKRSAGETDSFFILNGNPANIGKNCFIVFAIHYTLYRVRGITVQYESEPFEICAVEGCANQARPLTNVSTLTGGIPWKFE